MTGVLVPLLLAVLVLFDAMLAGFRSAAGRDGRLEKTAYLRGAIARGVAWGLAIVAVHGALVALLVITAPVSAATWRAFVEAGLVAIWVLGGFATLTLAALLLWLSPISEHRLLASIIVLGPFTLARPLVIAGGLGAAVATVADRRVWLVAISAAACMLALERVLGRPYVTRWRRLRDGSGQKLDAEREE